MKKFTLEFTEEQINYILNAVAQRPYAECHALLADIQKQASEQPQMEVVEELV